MMEAKRISYRTKTGLVCQLMGKGKLMVLLKRRGWSLKEAGRLQPPADVGRFFLIFPCDEYNNLELQGRSEAQFSESCEGVGACA